MRPDLVCIEETTSVPGAEHDERTVMHGPRARSAVPANLAIPFSPHTIHIQPFEPCARPLPTMRQRGEIPSLCRARLMMARACPRVLVNATLLTAHRRSKHAIEARCAVRSERGVHIVLHSAHLPTLPIIRFKKKGRNQPQQKNSSAYLCPDLKHSIPHVHVLLCAFTEVRATHSTRICLLSLDLCLWSQDQVAHRAWKLAVSQKLRKPAMYVCQVGGDENLQSLALSSLRVVCLSSLRVVSLFLIPHQHSPSARYKKGVTKTLSFLLPHIPQGDVLLRDFADQTKE
jgi:hypothetical protein